VRRTTAWLAGPWSLKFLYLWYFIATGIYSPYLGLYLRAIRLDGAQIGLVASMAPLAGVLLQPLWGTLSDRLGWRRPLLSLALLAAALIAPAVALAHTFAALLLLVIALAVAISPAVPLADATTLEWIGRHGGSYGAVRIYGSLGYLLASLGVGLFYRGRHILLLFPLYGFLLFGTCLVSLAAPRQGEAVHLAHGEGLGTVLQDRVVVLFLALAVVGYGTYAAYNTFFALYLKGLGAGTDVVGLAAGLASLSELPVMALAGRIMARVGIKPLLLAGLGAAALRWLAYGLLHDYRVALAFGLLHGLSFAGFYVAGVTFIDRRVPEHLRSTGQTLFFGATFGLGSVAGSNLFGVLFDHLHAGGMYLVAAALCALSVGGLALFLPNVSVQRALRD
jgi:PPP family 3-phenylpropionic acid transporter